MATRVHIANSCRDRRPIAGRCFARMLECYGGPSDGERRQLPADEYAIDGEHGHYVATVTNASERLEWIPD